jgi:hypothetical protein
MNGVQDLIARIVDAVYTSAEYDEYLLFKYLIIKGITSGKMYPVKVTTTDIKNAAVAFRGISNQLTFIGTDYNASGVHTNTPKSDQYIFMDSMFNAQFDVNVLASAFNMDRAQFMGNRVPIDGFGSLDNERLAELFADDPYYVEITDEELAALNEIPLAVVDENFFMVYDNLNEFREVENGQGLYWNYFYHQWKTFSTSPFSNAIVYVPVTPTVESVEVTPATATVAAGTSLALTTVVTTTGYAPQTVTYESDTVGVEITEGGVVQIGADVSGTVVITVKSTFDSTKSDTVTLTVS